MNSKILMYEYAGTQIPLNIDDTFILFDIYQLNFEYTSYLRIISTLVFRTLKGLLIF